MEKPRIYIDTSVVGGCFDEAFAKESLALMQAARGGRIVLLASDLLATELAPGPPALQDLLRHLPEGASEKVPLTPESLRLRDSYLRARVVGPACANDALHIALATVNRADLVVSWNFKHIVHWDKIRKFNEVNRAEGYPPIDIRSPQEVI